VKRLILVAMLVIAGALAGCSSADAPSRAAASSREPQPSAAQTGVRLSDFHSVACNLLGPGENDDPRLVFWVHLQVNGGIAVTVRRLTIQWHRKDITGPVIATETDPVGPGRPPVAHNRLWAFAWANTSGLTVSHNSATGPDPVACTVKAISGFTTTSSSGS
jgi:hypothetical protein